MKERIKMMIRKNLVYIFLVLAFTLAAPTIYVRHYSNSSQASSSQASNVSASNSQSKSPIKNGMRKLYPRSIVLNLESDLPTPVPPHQPFTLHLSVTTPQDMSGVAVNWIIPPQVEIVSGNKDATLNTIADKPDQTWITLRVPDAKNYHIIANVTYIHKGPDGGTQGAEEHFFTNPQADKGTQPPSESTGGDQNKLAPPGRQKAVRIHH